MGVAQVTTVGDIEAARRLCGQGGASLCLVTYTEAVLDVAQPVTSFFAPGQDSGTPSLMLVDAVTPYSRRIARHAGYRGAVHAKIAPQMLYRRIGAALQHRRARRDSREPSLSGSTGKCLPKLSNFAGRPGTKTVFTPHLRC